MTLSFYKYYLIFFLVFAISCSEKEQKPFTFVQLCDTQLGMGGYEHDIKTFKQAVKQINLINPDFVIICGDLVNDASDSSFADFNKIRSQFKMSCYCVSGNHDVGNVPNDSTLSFYRETIGKDYYGFENKGYAFVVTNSQLWKENVENESKKHDDWFKKTIDSIKETNQPIFVAGHYPLFIETVDEEEAYFNLPSTKRKEILNIFTKSDVVAYLSGHAHRPLINNYKNIQLVSGEATSKNLDSTIALGFRVWNVSKDTIFQNFVPLQLSEIE
ncbi:MAG: metallophosphoesterase [Flavobacteriaceae bacterium]|nr:metallophosphoesterase [Flavobacteriaceae bacterium]